MQSSAQVKSKIPYLLSHISSFFSNFPYPSLGESGIIPA